MPLMAYQGVGALIAMVLIGFWIGRNHYMDVFKKAIGKATHIDDRDEIISYRLAVIGCVGSIFIMSVWLWIMGTKLWVAILFVLVALLIFIGITRIVSEAGLAAVRLNDSPRFVNIGIWLHSNRIRRYMESFYGIYLGGRC